MSFIIFYKKFEKIIINNYRRKSIFKPLKKSNMKTQTVKLFPEYRIAYTVLPYQTLSKNEKAALTCLEKGDIQQFNKFCSYAQLSFCQIMKVKSQLTLNDIKPTI